MGRRTPLPRPGHPRPRTPDHHPRYYQRRGSDYRPVPGPDRLNTSRITPNRYTTPEDLTVMGCVRAGHRGEAWLKKGLLVCSKQRCPSSLTQGRIEAGRRVMDLVVIGMDPHKRSVTIEARDAREVLRATGRFGTDGRSYR